MPSYNIEAVAVSYSEEQNDYYSPPSSNDTTAYSTAAVATSSSGSTRNNSNTTDVIPTTSHASTHCSGHSGVTTSAPYSYYPYTASHYHGPYGRYYHPQPYSSNTHCYPGHNVPSNETTSTATTSTPQPVPSVEREDPYRPLSHHVVVAPPIHEGYYCTERSCPSSYHPTGDVASTTAPSNHHYNSTSTSTSTPARSNKLDWVDDNNSPRGVMDYHHYDAYSNPYESSPNGPGYDSYRYDTPHATTVHHGQEQYPMYNQSMSSWEQQPPPTQYYNPPSAARLPPPADDRSNTKHQFRKEARDRNSEPIILKKSFSWRNYPELEQYLIANRTKYLQHSAKNYTVEQKQFNNRLTDGLLQVAADYNYIFDESCFDFVSVRDRIRCYYKSYVQSLKKRGVARTLDDRKMMSKKSRC